MNDALTADLYKQAQFLWVFMPCFDARPFVGAAIVSVLNQAWKIEVSAGASQPMKV